MILPVNYLPFALDYGSNLFCVNLNTNEVVIVWMDMGSMTEKNIKVLTNDFNEFLSSLEPEE
ncbi:MAG: SMI1/KNR4 family protein [Eubacteriales bacterium]|nr:SMI1/KNR4 family protein [Eubacteriales bacterium]